MRKRVSLKRTLNVLYLDTLENQTKNNTLNKFVICHQNVEGIRVIPELTPSVPLLKKWESRVIRWDQFQQRFKAELREEYRKGGDQSTQKVRKLLRQKRCYALLP